MLPYSQALPAPSTHRSHHDRILTRLPTFHRRADKTARDAGSQRLFAADALFPCRDQSRFSPCTSKCARFRLLTPREHPEGCAQNDPRQNRSNSKRHADDAASFWVSSRSAVFATAAGLAVANSERIA